MSYWNALSLITYIIRELTLTTPFRMALPHLPRPLVSLSLLYFSATHHRRHMGLLVCLLSFVPHWM